MERTDAGTSLADLLANTSTKADALSATVNDITVAMAGGGTQTQARSGGGAGDGADGLTKMLETIRGSFAGLGDEAVAAGRDMAGAFADAGIGAVDFSGLLGDIFDALGGIGGKAGELIGLFGNLFRGGGLGDLLGGLGGIFGFAPAAAPYSRACRRLSASAGRSCSSRPGPGASPMGPTPAACWAGRR